MHFVYAEDFEFENLNFNVFQVQLLTSSKTKTSKNICQETNVEAYFSSPHTISLFRHRDGRYHLLIWWGFIGRPCRGEAKKDPKGYFNGSYQLSAELKRRPLQKEFSNFTWVDADDDTFNYILDLKADQFEYYVSLSFDIPAGELNPNNVFQLNILLEKTDNLFGFIPISEKKYGGAWMFKLYQNDQQTWQFEPYPF